MYRFFEITRNEFWRGNCAYDSRQKFSTWFSFFSGISFFLVFFFLVFFFLEKLKFTHSLVWKACFFFRWWKKKTAFLLTHTIFDRKLQKTNFSLKKKTLPLGIPPHPSIHKLSSSGLGCRSVLEPEGTLKVLSRKLSVLRVFAHEFVLIQLFAKKGLPSGTENKKRTFRSKIVNVTYLQ